jgi:hypothetical protein
MNNETKLQQLFHVLRLCGAAMIVAAAGTFLVQSWDGTGDVARYFALLGATALLPAVAYVCGVRFQESRSARVLVLTFLALVPIHAGVLGGFVLSQFGAPTTALVSVPQWVAPSRLSAIALFAGAAVVLVPLTWGAFRVLARPHAALLTAVNAGSNALLLIPDRSVRAATFAVVPVLAAAAWCAWRTKPATREARLALGFLLAPAAVITARQVLFYDVSSAFWAAILAACAIGLFVMGRKSGDATVERVAFVPTAFAVAAIVFDSSLLRQVPLSTQWLLYGWTTGLACIGFALASQRSKGFFVECIHRREHLGLGAATIGCASSDRSRAGSDELRLRQRPQARSLPRDRSRGFRLHRRSRTRDRDLRAERLACSRWLGRSVGRPHRLARASGAGGALGRSGCQSV